VVWYLIEFIFFVLYLSHTSLAALAELCKGLLAVSCLSVCPSEWDTLAPTGWIFMKFYIGWFY